ncbi:hypothetical protein [Pseudonocardia dioxanivorans]|uniref:hypothetical protein n=1 Tax=Pseudonocardia dioxanivorans TaxID=240495 RepID=UPI000319FBAF|nr:hypothetical protein [Pseudonocardia dioxanivorans]
MVDLVVDHYATMRNHDTKRFGMDLAVFLLVPAVVGGFTFVVGAQVRHLPEVLAATAIFTGLIFGVFVLMFDMTMRATDKSDPARGAMVIRLAAELRANISYAVLLGILLSGVLGGFVMFTDGDRVPPSISALIVFGSLQLLLTIFMVLKRVRALYLAYPAAQRDRIP